MVVLNDIVRDGRVLKSAATAAAAGLDVTILGRRPNSDVEQVRQEERIGDVSILRVPVPLVITGHVSRAPLRETLSPSRILGYRNQKQFVYATHQRKRRERRWRTSAARPRTPGRPANIAKISARLYRELIRVDHAVWDFRRICFAPERHRPRWDNLLTTIIDFDYAFSAEIERIKPDLVHAHDFTAISIVGAAVQRLRAAGHPVKWLYDAHEYVPGIALPNQALIEAYVDMERAWIYNADATITVGPLLAEEMMSDLKLAEKPEIVLNCPLEASFGSGTDTSIRSTIGLSQNERLIVYSGGVTKARGVDTVVRALPLLPTHHFVVVVADPTTPVMTELLALANELGVADRVHTAPFVSQQDITTYLATADIAAHTLTHWGNHEVALPNKLFEYIHAGLPVAVSDVQAMSQFVNKHAIGEVFVSEDPRSFADAVQAIEANYEQFRSAVHHPDLRAEYRWETQASKLVSIYGRLLDRSLTAPSGPAIGHQLEVVNQCALALDRQDSANPHASIAET